MGLGRYEILAADFDLAKKGFLRGPVIKHVGALSAAVLSDFVRDRHVRNHLFRGCRFYSWDDLIRESAFKIQVPETAEATLNLFQIQKGASPRPPGYSRLHPPDHLLTTNAPLTDAKQVFKTNPWKLWKHRRLPPGVFATALNNLLPKQPNETPEEERARLLTILSIPEPYAPPGGLPPPDPHPPLPCLRSYVPVEITKADFLALPIFDRRTDRPLPTVEVGYTWKFLNNNYAHRRLENRTEFWRAQYAEPVPRNIVLMRNAFVIRDTDGKPLDHYELLLEIQEDVFKATGVKILPNSEIQRKAETRLAAQETRRSAWNSATPSAPCDRCGHTKEKHLSSGCQFAKDTIAECDCFHFSIRNSISSSNQDQDPDPDPDPDPHSLSSSGNPEQGASLDKLDDELEEFEAMATPFGTRGTSAR